MEERSIVCGNQYQNSFEVWQGGKEHIFDGFECALHPLTPVCQRCSCGIIGHGIEVENGCYYCAHCARQDGYMQARDH